MNKRILALVTATALSLSLAACGQKGSEPTPEAGIYTPGTYTGEAQGFGGTVAVTLTVDSSTITEVVITGADETESIGGAALAKLAEEIKTAQSAEIDGVSGATVTSTAAKEAAGKAIAAAKGEEPTAAALTDGTYTATKEGYQKEHVTLSVTIAEGKIADVRIDEVTDHPTTITDAPCTQIPAAIVANQSYNVDGVTGATFTSNAIKNAVKDCLEQAGGSDAFSTAPEKTPLTQGEDVHTDILVVGGGAAGMTAASEAYNGETLGETSGLKVTLIEKAGFLGGNTSVSGGCFYTYTDETGAYDEAWRQSVVETEIEHMAGDMQDNVNRELLYGETGVMKRTLDLLNHADATYTDTGFGWLCFDPPEGGKDKKWAGSYMTKKMYKYFDQTDIDVRLNTAATGLLTDETGAVIGVKAEDKTSTYNIYAQKVILATGGFAANKDLIEEYAPEWDDALTFCAGTNTGDGFAMATELGADTVGSTMFSTVGVDNVIGIRPDYCMSFIFASAPHMAVNLSGERFVDETRTGYNRSAEIAKQEATTAWGIVDSDSPSVAAASSEADLEAGYVVKADSLEELAGKIGVPADKLMETVSTYNSTIDNNGEDAFGVPVEMMDRLDAAPYYAMLMRPCTITSLVGVTVDNGARVINTNGEVIENLFASGDMVLGNLLKTYTAARGVGTAIYSGDLAARTAKAEIGSK